MTQQLEKAIYDAVNAVMVVPLDSWESGQETLGRIIYFTQAAVKRIEWLEFMVNAPTAESTKEWQAALKKFLES